MVSPNFNFPPPIVPPQHFNIVPQQTANWAPPTGPALNPNLLPTPPSQRREKLADIVDVSKLAYHGVKGRLSLVRQYRAAERQEQAQRKLDFYKSLGEKAATGIVTTQRRARGSLTPSAPRPQTFFERSHAVKTSQKRFKADVKQLYKEREYKNSGAYKNKAVGTNVSTLKTWKAKRAIRKDFRRGKMTADERNIALLSAHSSPAPEQLKQAGYAKSIERKQEKSLRKAKNEAYHPVISRYTSIRNKLAQRTERKQQEATQKHIQAYIDIQARRQARQNP